MEGEDRWKKCSLLSAMCIVRKYEGNNLRSLRNWMEAGFSKRISHYTLFLYICSLLVTFIASYLVVVKRKFSVHRRCGTGEETSGTKNQFGFWSFEQDLSVV